MADNCDKNNDTQYNLRLALDDVYRSSIKIESIINEILHVVRSSYDDYSSDYRARKYKGARDELARCLDWKHYFHALDWASE